MLSAVSVTLLPFLQPSIVAGGWDLASLSICFQGMYVLGSRPLHNHHGKFHQASTTYLSKQLKQSAITN